MIFATNVALSQHLPVQLNTNKGFTYSSSSFTYNKIYNNLPVSGIPSNFYSCNLSFFCKQEKKFESVTKIPFKFRIGSVQYCDWMEGKKGTSVLKPGN